MYIEENIEKQTQQSLNLGIIEYFLKNVSVKLKSQKIDDFKNIKHYLKQPNLLCNKRYIRMLPHFIFNIKSLTIKMSSLKKHVQFNCDFVYASFYFNDSLFLQHCQEIGELYEANKLVSSTIVDLYLAAKCYERNYDRIRVNLTQVSSILKSDLERFLCSKTTELNKLIGEFESREALN